MKYLIIIILAGLSNLGFSQDVKSPYINTNVGTGGAAVFPSTTNPAIGNLGYAIGRRAALKRQEKNREAEIEAEVQRRLKEKDPDIKAEFTMKEGKAYQVPMGEMWYIENMKDNVIVFYDRDTTIEMMAFPIEPKKIVVSTFDDNVKTVNRFIVESRYLQVDEGAVILSSKGTKVTVVDRLSGSLD